MPLIKFNLENKNKNQIKIEILNKFNKIQNIVNNDKNYTEILYNIINHSLSKKNNIKINLDKYGNYKIIDNISNKVLSDGIYNSISVGGLPNNSNVEQENQEEQSNNEEDDNEEDDKEEELNSEEENNNEEETNDGDENENQEELNNGEGNSQEVDSQEKDEKLAQAQSNLKNVSKKVDNIKTVLDNLGEKENEDSSKNGSQDENENAVDKQSDKKEDEKNSVNQGENTPKKGNGFLSLFGFGNNGKQSETQKQENPKDSDQNQDKTFGFNDVTKKVDNMIPDLGPEETKQEGGYYSSDDENYLDDFQNHTLMFHQDEEDNLMSHFNNMTNKEYLNQLNYQDLRTIMKNNQMRLTNNGNYYNKKEMVNKIYNFYK